MVFKETEYASLITKSIEKYPNLSKYYDNWIHCVLIPMGLFKEDSSLQEEMLNLLYEEHIEYRGDTYNWCMEIVESDGKQVFLRVVETWS